MLLLRTASVMSGDVMRIQRTPRSMPAVFSPCIQTQGPRLYKERVTAVRKPRFLGVLCLFPTVTMPWSSIQLVRQERC